MSYVIKSKQYASLLNRQQTERGIKLVKDFFQANLSAELRLRRVTAPLFVAKGTGINDDLNGVERAVTFAVKDVDGMTAEIVHSLAKWKRLTLADLKIDEGFGLYTDMNAIRAHEELGNFHWLYVDQWDWELVMSPEDRRLAFLKDIVKRIYASIVRTEYLVYEAFGEIKPILPREIAFVHAEELAKKFPGLSPKEREDKITKEYGAVFIIGVGGALSDGKQHDGRAPDYDDWTSPNEEGFRGLNGDIFVWNTVLERAMELSSMGIRVDKNAMNEQLKITGTEQRKDLYFHRRLLAGELPQTIGGGIGQSRLCMFLLRKWHIGEIQVGIWPKEILDEAAKYGVTLL